MSSATFHPYLQIVPVLVQKWANHLVLVLEMGDLKWANHLVLEMGDLKVLVMVMGQMNVEW